MPNIFFSAAAASIGGVKGTERSWKCVGLTFACSAPVSCVLLCAGVDSCALASRLPFPFRVCASSRSRHVSLGLAGR